jgi:hypothetical protein
MNTVSVAGLFESGAWISFRRILFSFRRGFDFLPAALLPCGRVWKSRTGRRPDAQRICLPNKA